MSSNILCNQLTVRDTLKNVTLDNVTITSLQLDSASATDGYVLTSDGSGNATWEALPVGGAPTFGNGTEALPSITFASDTGTGIYRPSAGTMGLVSAGSSVATVSASGITVAGGKVSSDTLQVVDDAVTGYVLTSGDNNGNATWSGQILLPDGTFANPSYGFVNHAGCGMFCDSDTKLSLTVGNDPMLEITDSGVGIGGDGIFSGTVTCSSVEASNGASGAPSHSFTNFPKNGMFSTSLTTLTLTVNDTDTMELYDNGDGIAVDGNVDVGGSLLVLDGSAAEPSITFTSDSNTGIYRKGNDNLSIVANGTEVINSTTSSVDVMTGLAVKISSGLNVLATAAGTIAHGYARNSTTIQASQWGSFAGGYSSDGGSIVAAGYGSFSHGVSVGRNVKSSGHAAFTNGYTDETATIESSTFSSFTNAYARLTGTVLNSGEAGLVTAHVNGGSVSNSGNAGAIIGATVTGETCSNAADASLLVGRSTTLSAANDYSILLGQYGTSLTTADTLPLATDTGCLQIASGTSGSPDISVVIGTDTPGTGSIGKGYANAWETSGADYAEFFEWEDGNVDEQDRIGYFVKLTGDGKIVKANAVDALASNVLGIVTSTQSHTAFIADGHAMKWCGIAMRDDFGRLLTELTYKQPTLDVLYAHYAGLDAVDRPDEEVTPPQALIDAINARQDNDASIVDLLDESLRDQVVPVRCNRINPDYDRDAAYIRRNDRPEWDPISLLGKVYVRDDGTCVVGQKCTCNADGIATPGSDWFVMERKSANVIRVFFK